MYITNIQDLHNNLQQNSSLLTYVYNKLSSKRSAQGYWKG